MRRFTNVLTRVVTSPINYWSGMALDAAVAVGLLAYALRTAHERVMADAGLLLAGLALYGLLEYVSHRFLYHAAVSPLSPGHWLHHLDPQALIALPCFVTSAAGLTLWAGFRWLLADDAASVLVAALMIGFVFYGGLHHALHHGRHRRRYIRFLHAYHQIHHRLPDRNFGVTMTVWDWVFGTHYLLVKRRRPGAEFGSA